LDPKQRQSFAQIAAQAALIATQANRQPTITYLVQLAEQAESPLAARVVTVFAAMRAALLAHGHARYAVALAEPPEVLTWWNDPPRIRYVSEPLDPWLHALMVAHAIRPLNVAVAIDDDDRGWTRDPPSPALAWRIFRIGRKEFHQQPASLVADILEAAADALEAAQAALSLCDSLWSLSLKRNVNRG
jgi:hypothetical protein